MENQVLSPESIRSFEKWGYVRVPQALSEAFVENVRKVIWRELKAHYGMLETDPSTWRPEWCGVNKDKIDGFAKCPVTDCLAHAINQILGVEQWRPIRTYGGLLMTMPEQNPTPWEVADKGWHFDNDPRAYAGGFDELMMFTFYSHVEPQGGGTLVLAGSHHVAEAYVQSVTIPERRVNDLVNAFGKWHPYLAELQGFQPRERNASQWLETTADVYGVEVTVVELTGEPGEAILCHPALWHSGSRNTAPIPRIMRRTNIRRVKR